MLKERNALILYGSETGNSEDLAHQLGCTFERLHFVVRICEMNAVAASALNKYSIVIFTLSTTGQGEFPKNASTFWRSLLKKRLPIEYLTHVSFTTFGLGDSSYPKFNISARKLHKRLLQLGASEIYTAGEADDQHQEGIDGTYLPWSYDLQNYLITTFPLPEGLKPIPPEVFLPPKYFLEINQDLKDTATSIRDTQLLENDQGPTSHRGADMDLLNPRNPHQVAPEMENIWNLGSESQPNIECKSLKEEHNANNLLTGKMFLPANEHISLPDGYNATLRTNNRMTPNDHFQDVRELIFNFKDQIFYEPGDSIMIYPKNFSEDVDHLINMMNWQTVADQPLRFKPDYPDYFCDRWLESAAPHLHPIPNSTLRQLLTHNLDITAVPKRRFFEVIAHYTENPKHKERLLEFANPIYIDEFYDYTSRPRRSILEVLEDFSSVQLPWHYITSIMPVMRGRAYSIASGGAERLVFTRTGMVSSVKILVAIVKYKTVLRKFRRGLCSRYLESLKERTTIQVQFQKSQSFYKLAQISPHLPLILVAPGTGIAPCRSLIFERKDLTSCTERKTETTNIGFHFLFFGGRNRRADYFYEQDWFAKSMRTTVFPAFSRDQKEKVYVQDMIRREAKLVATLILKEKAIIYVCGSSGNMPKGVKNAFIYALMSCDLDVMLPGMPFTRETATQKLEEMVKTGYYVQETW